MSERFVLLRKICVDLVILMLFVSFVVLIINNLNVIVLDTVVVPDDLTESGYTKSVVADKLLDAVREIGSETQRVARQSSWYDITKNDNNIAILEDLPNIQVPGADFTVRALFQYIQQALGFGSNIRGEITKSEEGYKLTLRNLSEKIPAIQTPAENDLDRLIKDYGGNALLKLTKPKILVIHAFHQFQQKVSTPPDSHAESLRKLNEIIEYCLEYSTTTDRPLVLNIKAITSYELKEFEEAIIQFERIIELYPEYTFAYNSLGRALNDKERYEKADEQLKKAISLNPKYVNAYFNRGISLLGLNRRKEAIESFQKVIDLDPKFYLAYQRLGLEFMKLGHREDAIKNFQKIIDLEPKSAEAHYNLGIALNAAERYEDAIEEFNKTIRLNPEFVDAYNDLGKLFQAQGRDNEAEAIFQKLNELSKELPD
ncbi:MAG TPA: tetratricopeptide repeat protein [Nitrosomonas sp.]|nr:tetratricopeptide repeat protein [Nitrosomonas sp.]